MHKRTETKRSKLKEKCDVSQSRDNVARVYIDTRRGPPRPLSRAQREDSSRISTHRIAENERKQDTKTTHVEVYAYGYRGHNNK